jgi:AcrR family transcriptional regulator
VAVKVDKRAQAAKTRHNLLLAAAEVFDRHGYAGTNLHAVCDRAQVTKGALYCHFRSKEALAVALIEHQSLLWHQLKDDLLERRLGPTQTLIDMSFEYVRRVETDLMARVCGRLMREGALFDLTAAGQLVGWVTVVREMLRSAEREGELLVGLNLRHLAENLVAEFLGLQLLSQALTGQRDLSTRLCRFWRLRIPPLVGDGALDTLRFDPPDLVPAAAGLTIMNSGYSGTSEA